MKALTSRRSASPAVGLTKRAPFWVRVLAWLGRSRVRPHFEAMTLYYQHIGWGVHVSDQACDKQTYAEHGCE